VRRGIARDKAIKARVGKSFQLPLIGTKSGPLVKGQRIRTIKRAGVHPHPLNAGFRPAYLQRHCHQPFAMTFARQLWHEAEKGNLALSGLPEIQLQYPNLNTALVKHGPDAHGRVVDDAQKIRVIKRKPGEPKPWFANATI